MTERDSTQLHTGWVVLEIGDGAGALVVRTTPDLRGDEIEVSPVGDAARRIHTAVLARQINGQRYYAAVFPRLVPGEYTLWGWHPGQTRRVAIEAGVVATVDWREGSPG